MNAIDHAIASCNGGPCYIVLRVRIPVMKDLKLPNGDQQFFVIDQPVQFQAEASARVFDGWEFQLKEKSPQNELVNVKLTVRSEDIAYVRVVSPILAGAS